jgi:predicted ArsR family transcriptional regulator
MPSLLGFGDDYIAARAYSAFGISHRRVEILRFLMSRRESSVADLMCEFALTRNGALGHLKAMERQGLVSVRHSTHPRGAGPISYWRADTAAVRELLEGLLSHVFSAL